MPITPFHMGPGLAVKSVTGRHVSLMVFGVSQVLIDLEPGIGLVRDAPVLHGWTHTFVGATLIGVVATVVGRPVCQWMLRFWPTSVRYAAFLDWLRGPPEISWPAAAAGAFIGTYSHIFLDGTMHLDMRPFAPFSDWNPLLGTVAELTTYAGCVIAGMVGWAVVLGRYRAAESARVESGRMADLPG